MSDIVRNKNKNDWKSMFDFYIKYNETPVSKGVLMGMAYTSTRGVDSAIPQSLWGELDDTFYYVYDYTDKSLGELVDLRQKLKFSNNKVDITIVVNGDVLYKERLPEELQNVTFHQALKYVFNNDEVEAFDIRPKTKEMAKGGKVLGKIGDITFTRGRGRGMVKDVYFKNDDMPSHYISYSDNIEEINEGLKSWSKIHKKDFNQIEKVHFAEGGNLKAIAKKFERNEDNNAHSENVVLLAKHFGTKEELAEANSILKKHNEEGSLSSENGRKRYALYEKLMKKARLQMSKEGIKFSTGGGVEDKYIVVNGTSYDKKTPKEVIDVLENVRANRTKIKIYYGDHETGRDWKETYDTVGTVGRSTGTVKIPLLIKLNTSTGGGGILTANIVKIKDTKTGRVLYQSKNYKQPTVDITPSDMEDKGYTHNVVADGEIYGRHKSLKSAQILKSKLMATGGGIEEEIGTVYDAFRLIEYDVWGNEEDGFEVNNKFKTSKIVLLAEGMTDEEIVDLLIEEGELKAVAKGRIDIDGEFDYTLYLTDNQTGRPIMELEKTEGLENYSKGGIIPNQRTDTKFDSYTAVGYAEGFVEAPSMEAEIEAWAYLIATRQAYSLQGRFGRQAESLIANGIIARDGTINWDKVDSMSDEQYGQGGRLTVGEVKRRLEEKGSYYFSKDTMRFFGQKMSDFKLNKLPNGKYLMTAPTRYSNHTGKMVMGEPSQVIFNPETNEIERLTTEQKARLKQGLKLYEDGGSLLGGWSYDIGGL